MSPNSQSNMAAKARRSITGSRVDRRGCCHSTSTDFLSFCARRSGLSFMFACLGSVCRLRPKCLSEVLLSAKETIPTDRHGLNNDLVQHAKGDGLHECLCKCSKQAIDRLLARVDCMPKSKQDRRRQRSHDSVG